MVYGPTTEAPSPPTCRRLPGSIRLSHSKIIDRAGPTLDSHVKIADRAGPTLDSRMGMKRRAIYFFEFPYGKHPSDRRNLQFLYVKRLSNRRDPRLLYGKRRSNRCDGRFSSIFRRSTPTAPLGGESPHVFASPDVEYVRLGMALKRYASQVQASKRSKGESAMMGTLWSAPVLRGSDRRRCDA